MSEKNWIDQSRPIVALSPMDGYTDSAFRRVCKSINNNIIVFTEFVSADGLSHHAARLLEKIKFHSSEKPIIAQIFGKDPATMAKAAVGAILAASELAFSLIEAVVKATPLPVSVKTRLGWSSSDDLVEFGCGVEAGGAKLITIHGRTYSQGFSALSDWEPIYQLKTKLKIPVLGNGDVQSIDDGMNKLKNLDGFMIGRAAIGNPWIFGSDPIPTFQQKIPLILQHCQWLVEAKGEKSAMLEIRKHLLAYVKGLPNASNYRAQLVRVTSYQELEAAISSIV